METIGVLSVRRAVDKDSTAEAIEKRSNEIRHKVMQENKRMKRLLLDIRSELADGKINKAKMEKLVERIQNVVSLEE